MTDREFAKEALEYIKRMAMSDEHYRLTREGNAHFDRLCELAAECEMSKGSNFYMNKLAEIEPVIEAIKGVANDGHIVNGKKYSGSDILLIMLLGLADKINEIPIKIKTDDWDDTLEFETMDDLVSKLFGGGNE